MTKSKELVNIYENRKAVEKVGTKFKIKGLGDSEFESLGNKKGEVIGFIDNFGNGISLKDIGNKKAYCFTYTIFGKKVKDSFYFEDVEVISVVEVEEKVEEKKEAAE
jgi:hypothetical protein